MTPPAPPERRAAECALLVVDDNEDNRYALARRLAREGYSNVVTATNGREALDLLAARRFDLVLLDVMMPELNGYEVLERLRADDRLRHVPVIMISAVDQIESVVRCIELGAEDYLSKPFNPTLLRARVGASLERKRLRDEIVAHLDRIERELATAREIQLGMVPAEFPTPTWDRPVDLYAILEPARQVGGDLYDFFWRGPRTLCLLVADVSDKGAPAALFMARTKTLIRLVATLVGEADGRAPTPDEIVTRVNEDLCRDNAHGMFATLFFGMLDVPTGDFRFCNAGHTVPYIIGSGGVVPLGGGRAKPVGIRPTLSYAAAATRLDPGDCLFVFTDGITECMDGDGAFFSDERLERVLASLAGQPPRAIVEAVMTSVRQFAGAAPQSDDIAVMALRRIPVIAETVIGNRRDDLARVTRLVDDLASAYRLAPDVVADVHVALDEVLTNIIAYGYDDDRTHEIVVRLAVEGDVVEAEILDDGWPFDPTAVPAPDRSAPLRERRIGGLGMHFVRQLMSEVTYERAGERNRLLLKRRVNSRSEAHHRGHA